MININKVKNQIKVEVNSLNGGSLYFKFKGEVLDDDFDIARISIILNNIFDDYVIKDMEKIVSWLRTLFEEIEEKELSIILSSDYGSSCCQFIDGKLKKYIKNDKIDDDNNLSFIYSFSEGVNIKFNESQLKNIDRKKVNEVIEKELSRVWMLNGIKAIEMDKNAEALCKIYKLFYGEDPDFSISSTKIKSQYMMALLERYGVSLGDDYFFHKLQSGSVQSFELTKLMSDLSIFGVIDSKVINVKLSDYVEDVIKIVGKEVNEFLNMQPDKLESLNEIVEMQYEITHKIPFDYNEFKLSKLLDRSSLPLESKIKLLRKIDDKLDHRVEY